MKLRKIKVDTIFKFISDKTKMNKELSITVPEIREAMKLTKSSCNNNLQYLYKNNAVSKHKIENQVRYYSIITLDDYEIFCESHRKKGNKIDRKVADVINKFIYSGCPERICKNLNTRI